MFFLVHTAVRKFYKSPNCVHICVAIAASGNSFSNRKKRELLLKAMISKSKFSLATLTSIYLPERSSGTLLSFLTPLLLTTYSLFTLGKAGSRRACLSLLVGNEFLPFLAIIRKGRCEKAFKLYR